MKIYHIIIVFLLSLAPISISAQKGLDAPMTKAVMKVYQDLLNEDPTDYETYFHRACEYYKHNEYFKALSDINNALKYTPISEKNLIFDQLVLRANIYEQRGNLTDAITDLNAAYELDPTSYIVIYQRANLKYQLGNYSDAKADYIRMQRINNRSQEALIGLARIAVKENNFGLANEYADQAVSISPSQADIYVRRASIKSMMNNHNGAVDDLILAISTDNNNTRALQDLVKLSKINYAAVITGLSNAIRQAPRVGMFYYIRAVIAESHYKYMSAITDYKKIIQDNLYNYSGIYNSIAKCYYALGYYDEALENINYALSATNSNKEYFATKAKVLRALKNTTLAIECINKALIIDANYNDALIIKALIEADLGNYKNATALLGEASLNDPNNAYTYIMRAWILEKNLNQKDNANRFYNLVIDLNSYEIDSFKGFAYIGLDNKDKAISWIKSILSITSQPNGYYYYIATCLYAWIGDHRNALKYMELSLQNGYANYHDWKANNDGIINVSPIRDLPQFSELITKYNIIFN